MSAAYACCTRYAWLTARLPAAHLEPEHSAMAAKTAQKNLKNFATGHLEPGGGVGVVHMRTACILLRALCNNPDAELRIVPPTHTGCMPLHVLSLSTRTHPEPEVSVGVVHVYGPAPTCALHHTTKAAHHLPSRPHPP